MSIRHLAHAFVRNACTAKSRLRRFALASVLLVASISGQHAAAAADPVSGDAAMAHVTTLTRIQPDSGSITTDAGKEVTLSAAEQIDGQGVAGQEVDWTVSPVGQATVTPTSSMTSELSATSAAGIASTVLHATTPGDYIVTATTQKNPGCSGQSCATLSIRYMVSIAAPPMTACEVACAPGGLSGDQLIGGLVGLGTAIAIATNTGNNGGAAVMSTLAITSGGGQSAEANAPLAQPLVVHAENNGASVASVAVDWSASGGAVVSAPFSFTDATGSAFVNVVSVGPGPGPITITATRSDNPSATVSFTANVLLPSLKIVSGNGQSGLTNTQVAKPLVVEAELGGAPQSGVPMRWAVTGGSATIVSSGNTTNGSGQSSAVIEFGPNPGPVDITATRTDRGISQTFHLTSIQTLDLLIVSGNHQSGFANTRVANPLVVEALRNGMPQSAVPMKWTVKGSATIVSSVNTTNGAGQASAVIKFGPTAGPVEITATRTDDGMSQTFQLTSLQSTALLMASGNNQTGFTNSNVANPLVVEAELDDQPQGGVPITWKVIAGSASVVSVSNAGVTNASGQSSAVIRFGATPGSVQVMATRTGTTLSQTFHLTSVQTESLIYVSGSGQTGKPNARLPQTLLVKAITNNHAANGVTINWSQSGGATLSGQTSVTNGSGEAGIDITNLGPGPGPITVTATRADDPTGTVMFTEDIFPPVISVVTGSNQSGLIGSPAKAQLVVMLVNGANVPLSGQPVAWTITGGSLASSSTKTLANGQATVAFTYGDFQGPVTIQATANGVVTPAIFSETALIPGSLSIVGNGDNQSGAPGSTLPHLLTVQVQSPGAGANLSGVPITFTVVSGSASIVLPPGCTATTNTLGQACAQLQLGLTPGQVKVQAQVFGGPGLPAPFTETVTGSLVQPALSFVSGNVQTLIPGKASQPLIVKLTTGNNVAFTGQTIMWSATSGTLSASSGTTGPNGEPPAVTITPSGAGPITVTASFAAYNQYKATSSSVTFGTVPLVPGALTIVSGNNQAIIPGGTSHSLTVQLKGGGSPLGGQTINWSTTNGSISNSSTTTSTSGNASVMVTPTNAGPFTVTASFPGFQQYTAAQVTFSENTALVSLPTQTTNDQSVSAALDTACSSLQGVTNRSAQQQDLLNQCIALNSASSVSTPAVVNAIHQLTPDVTETQTQTATTATTAQFNNLSDRMTQLRGGAQGVSLSGLSFTNENGSLPLFDVGSALLGDDKPKQDSSSNAFSRWGFFASGQIGRQDASAIGQAPAYDLDIGGLTFGVDYRETDSLVLGGAVGYTRQTTTLANDDGSLTMNGWSLSGYATWYQKNNWYLDSSITWANNNYNSQRHIDYSLPLPGGGTTSVDQLAQASSGGDDLAGSLTFGRDFNSKAWAYGFYGKAQYSRQEFDGFQETLNSALPGSGLGLRVGERTIDQLDSVLGAKVDYTMSTSWGVVIPHAEAEWQHQFDGTPNAFQAYFVDDPTGSPILITGTPIDQNFFRLGLGFSFVFPQGRSAFILYDRTLGETGITQYNLSLGFRMEF